MPCAIQNELNEEDAKMLVKNGCKYVVEVSNMAALLKQLKFFMTIRYFLHRGKLQMQEACLYLVLR